MTLFQIVFKGPQSRCLRLLSLVLALVSGIGPWRVERAQAASGNTAVYEAGSSGLKLTIYGPDGKRIKSYKKTPRIGMAVDESTGIVAEKTFQEAVDDSTELISIAETDHGVDIRNDLQVVATAWARYEGGEVKHDGHVRKLLAKIVNLTRDDPIRDDQLEDHILTKEEESELEAEAAQRALREMAPRDLALALGLNVKESIMLAESSGMARRFYFAPGGTSLEIFSPETLVSFSLDGQTIESVQPAINVSLDLGSNDLRTMLEEELQTAIDDVEDIDSWLVQTARGFAKGGIGMNKRNNALMKTVRQAFKPGLSVPIIVGGPARDFIAYANDLAQQDATRPFHFLYQPDNRHVREPLGCGLSMARIEDFIDRGKPMSDSIYSSPPATVLVHTIFNHLGLGISHHVVAVDTGLRDSLNHRSLRERRAAR